MRHMYSDKKDTNHGFARLCILNLFILSGMLVVLASVLGVFVTLYSPHATRDSGNNIYDNITVEIENIGDLFSAWDGSDGNNTATSTPDTSEVSSPTEASTLKDLLLEISSSNLYKASPSSCSKIKQPYNRWTYVKCEHAMVQPVKCEQVPACGPGVWNRAFTISEGRRKNCPTGMVDSHLGCGLKSEIPVQCKYTDVHIPVKDGYSDICGVVSASRRPSDINATSSITITTKTDAKQQGISVAYLHRELEDADCSCADALSPDVEKIIKHGSQIDLSGGIRGSMSVRCGNVWDEHPRRCNSYNRKHFKISLDATSHRPMQLGVCSYVSESEQREHVFYLYELDIYVR